MEREVWTTIRLASVQFLRRILFAVKHTVSSGSATAFAKSLPILSIHCVDPAVERDPCQSSLATQPNSG